jgi:hypothetical protein
VAIFIELIPLRYIIIKADKRVPSTTTNFAVSFNTCYMFRCISHIDHQKHVACGDGTNKFCCGWWFDVSVLSSQTYEEHMEKTVNPLRPVTVVCSIKRGKVKGKVKCTLVQALRLCTGRTVIGGVEV